MRVFIAGALLLVAVAGLGCGSGASGPAKPEDTPVVTPEQVQEAYTKGMPEDVRKKYESRMKPGGSP